jgi:site-specific DNA-methyltransferase (adenine-specific)
LLPTSASALHSSEAATWWRWRNIVDVPFNQILLGDCCEVLAGLPEDCVDFVPTDPPYLVNYRDRLGHRFAGDDSPHWLKPAFRQIHRVLRADRLCVSFYGWTRTDPFFEAWKSAGFRVVGHLTFPKRNTSTTRLLRYQHEGAYLLAKGQPVAPTHPIGDVIDWVYSGNKLHPTQKPIGVLTPLIESFCPRGGLVLDPFAGSASTCVAARTVGRNYVSVEIDPAMHQVAERRMRGLAERLAALLNSLRPEAEAAESSPGVLETA